jgi:hypothetical protein
MAITKAQMVCTDGALKSHHPVRRILPRRIGLATKWNAGK